MTRERYIIHVDMDAFFASIEQRDNPAYRGRPVVVGADPKLGRGRGVVSAASYEARKYGIHSAMPISTAYRRCPDAVFLGVDMDRYIRESDKIFSILESFTPEVERVSVDEAFLDISDTYKKYGTPYKMCLAIKDLIRKGTGLTASIGLAPTKMAAKIASGLKKPDGLVEVRSEDLTGFLRPLQADRIWGIGKKTMAVLNNMGIHTIGELAARNKDELARTFGRNGEWFWEAAHGIDESEVSTEREVKSISNETTFEADVSDRDLIEKELSWLCELVADRMREEKFICRTVTLKIRFGNFETHTRQATFKQPITLAQDITVEIKRLFAAFDLAKRKVRLVGVKTSGLSPAQDNPRPATGKESIQKAIDKIRDKFGRGSIRRAGSRPF